MIDFVLLSFESNAIVDEFWRCLSGFLFNSHLSGWVISIGTRQWRTKSWVRSFWVCLYRCVHSRAPPVSIVLFPGFVTIFYVASSSHCIPPLGDRLGREKPLVSSYHDGAKTSCHRYLVFTLYFHFSLRVKNALTPRSILRFCEVIKCLRSANPIFYNSFVFLPRWKILERTLVQKRLIGFDLNSKQDEKTFVKKQWPRNYCFFAKWFSICFSHLRNGK